MKFNLFIKALWHVWGVWLLFARLTLSITGTCLIMVVAGGFLYSDPNTCYSWLDYIQAIANIIPPISLFYILLASFFYKSN